MTRIKAARAGRAHTELMDQTPFLRRLLACLDLTRLGEADTPGDIAALCELAARLPVPPAALCVHPEMIASARAGLSAHGLKRAAVATVVNFPDGSTDAARCTREIHRARGAGATEIDAVMPWRALLAGRVGAAVACLQSIRAASGRLPLKVIVESGELGTPERIREAALLAIECGADFIKTSTGKAQVHATPAAAEAMLDAIAETGATCGFKAAGGIRTPEEAAVYFALADHRLGPDWATPARFRIGASSLADAVLARFPTEA